MRLLLFVPVFLSIVLNLSACAEQKHNIKAELINCDSDSLDWKKFDKPDLIEIECLKNGLVQVTQEKYRLSGLFTHEGEEVLPIEYWIVWLNEKMDFAITEHYEINGARLLDSNGKILSKEGFDSIRDFKEGLSAVSRDEKHGFIDKSGKVIIPLTFDYACDFSEGFACVKVKDKWGFIGKTGKPIIPFDYGYTEREGFKNGEARVGDGKGKVFFINKKGEVTRELPFD